MTASYAAAASQTSRPLRAPADPAYRLPDPQEVAYAVKQLVDLPAGRRPLRTVVGPVFTDGVAEYNQTYEELRMHMEEVLRRPDQAITWTPAPRR